MGLAVVACVQIINGRANALESARRKQYLAAVESMLLPIEFTTLVSSLGRMRWISGHFMYCLYIPCSFHWDTKMCTMFFLLDLKKYARPGFWNKNVYGELWPPMMFQVIPTHSHSIARIFCWCVACAVSAMHITSSIHTWPEKNMTHWSCELCFHTSAARALNCF